MPIIKSAKKALRQTRKRTLANRRKKILLQTEIKKFRSHKETKTLRAIYVLADKLAGAGIIHQNKARRIKSRLSRMLNQTPAGKRVPKTV